MQYQITIALESDRPLTDAERDSLLHAVVTQVTEPVIDLRGEDGTVEDTDWATWQPLEVTVDMHPVTP